MQKSLNATSRNMIHRLFHSWSSYTCMHCINKIFIILLQFPSIFLWNSFLQECLQRTSATPSKIRVYCRVLQTFPATYSYAKLLVKCSNMKTILNFISNFVYVRCSFFRHLSLHVLHRLKILLNVRLLYIYSRLISWIASQMFKKFLAVYGTTGPTCCNWSLPWAKTIRSTASHLHFSTVILISFHHLCLGLPGWFS
jgi:hypothetical protein